MKYLIGIFILASGLQGCMTYTRACYYTNWSQYRPEPMTFFPGDIDPFLCTHIIFAFSDMQGNQLLPYEWNDVEMFGRLVALKQVNPALKIVLAVGGWNFGTAKMTSMLSSANNRTEFVTTTISYLRQHSLDGLQLHFMYPGSRGSPPEDKQRFTLLAQELRARFDQEAVDTGRAPLGIGSGVSCLDDIITNAYEIDLLDDYLDYFALMSFDFVDSTSIMAYYNAPLFNNDQSANLDYLNRSIDWCVNRFNTSSASANKLLIGQSPYGRSFTLILLTMTEVYDPVSGPGAQGTWTREPGLLAYYEICSMFLNDNETTVVDRPEYEVPYAYNEFQWVGYDDLNSVQAKSEYIQNNNLAGFNAWTLDLDDFTGSRCGQGPYPLLNKMKEILPDNPQQYPHDRCTPGEPVDSGDPCMPCFCDDDGQVQCAIIDCLCFVGEPSPFEECQCEGLYVPEGKCCAICPEEPPATQHEISPAKTEGELGGVELSSCTPGEPVDSGDPCMPCFCDDDGQVQCAIIDCLCFVGEESPFEECQCDGLYVPEGKCCAICPEELLATQSEISPAKTADELGGVELSRCTPGESVDSGDPCMPCFCDDDGQVQCAIIDCLCFVGEESPFEECQCDGLYVPEGKCCAICPEEPLATQSEISPAKTADELGGVELSSCTPGEPVDSGDPCMPCFCDDDGQVQCAIIDCLCFVGEESPFEECQCEGLYVPEGKCCAICPEELSATTSKISPAKIADFSCDGTPNGDYPNPDSCKSFLKCNAWEDPPVVVECETGLWYNADAEAPVCVWEWDLSEERLAECCILHPGELDCPATN